MKRIALCLLLVPSFFQASDTNTRGTALGIAGLVVGTPVTAYCFAHLVKPQIVMNPYKYTHKDPMRAFVENAVLSDHQKLRKYLANSPTERLQAMVRAHMYPRKSEINHAEQLRRVIFGIVSPCQTNQTSWITPENPDQFPQKDDLENSQWLHLARKVRNVSRAQYNQIDPAFTAAFAQSVQQAAAAHEVAKAVEEEVKASRKQVTTYSPIVNDDKVVGHSTKTEITDTAATKPLEKVQERFETKRDGHALVAGAVLFLGGLHNIFHMVNRNTPQGYVYNEMKHRASWADTIASYFRTSRYLQRTYQVQEIPVAVPVATEVAMPVATAPSKFE